MLTRYPSSHGVVTGWLPPQGHGFEPMVLGLIPPRGGVLMRQGEGDSVCGGQALDLPIDAKHVADNLRFYRRWRASERFDLRLSGAGWAMHAPAAHVLATRNDCDGLRTWVVGLGEDVVWAFE